MTGLWSSSQIQKRWALWVLWLVFLEKENKNKAKTPYLSLLGEQKIKRKITNLTCWFFQAEQLKWIIQGG